MSNASEIEKGIRKAYEIIDARVLRAMQETAEMIVADTESYIHEKNIIWTHNFHDSVGCGVYKDGVLRSYFAPITEAQDPRAGKDEFPLEARVISGSERPIWGDIGNIDRERAYWGTAELFEMLESPPGEILSLKGWAIYFVAAQPYSEILEMRYNYFQEERIAPYFISTIKSYANN